MQRESKESREQAINRIGNTVGAFLNNNVEKICKAAALVHREKNGWLKSFNDWYNAQSFLAGLIYDESYDPMPICKEIACNRI